MCDEQNPEPIPGKLYKTSINRFFYDKAFLDDKFTTFTFAPGSILLFVSKWWIKETEQYQFVWLHENKTLYSEHKEFADFNRQFKIITE